MEIETGRGGGGAGGDTTHHECVYEYVLDFYLATLLSICKLNPVSQAHVYVPNYCLGRARQLFTCTHICESVQGDVPTLF